MYTICTQFARKLLSKFHLLFWRVWKKVVYFLTALPFNHLSIVLTDIKQLLTIAQTIAKNCY